jgi:CBS domain-containing protein
MNIQDFLKIEGRGIITIGPKDTISRAIQKLIDNKIGALPVSSDEGMLIGIVSERDLLKECLTRGSAISKTKIQDVMNKNVVVATPDEDLEYATSVMKQKGIRHLPVVVGKKIEGIISMRDIVNIRLQDAEAEVRYGGLLRNVPHRHLL